MGITEVPINNTEEAMAAIDAGTKNRVVASTKMNMASSRSHALVILLVEQNNKLTGIRS